MSPSPVIEPRAAIGRHASGNGKEGISGGGREGGGDAAGPADSRTVSSFGYGGAPEAIAVAAIADVAGFLVIGWAGGEGREGGGERPAGEATSGFCRRLYDKYAGFRLP